MKASFVSKIAGALIIVSAVVMIGLKLEFWNFGINYDSTWTLIIAVPFLIWALIFGVNFINVAGFYTGLGLLIYNNGYVKESDLTYFIVVISMFAVGTLLAGSSYKFTKPTVLEPVVLSRTNPDIKVFAGMKHIQNRFKGITGGRFKVFSGSLLYDLRKSEIDNGIEMNVRVRFGKLYLVFKDDMMVQSDVKGNFTNGLAAPKDYKGIIKINGTVKFGKLYIMRSSPEEY